MNNQGKPAFIVWWVLWAAMLNGVFMFYFFLGSAAQHPTSLDNSPVWLAGFVPVSMSIVVRQLILPRLSNARAALSAFIFGLALAEGTCFMAIFIFPAHKLELFAGSVLGMLQFIPLFARRFYQNDGQR